MDRPRFEWVLVKPSPSQPFRIAIDVKPAYSTFNLNTLGLNNAFGNKIKLGAAGQIAPRVRFGMFATLEAETEQFTGVWRPSSQAGPAGFLNYEVRLDSSSRRKPGSGAPTRASTARENSAATCCRADLRMESRRERLVLRLLRAPAQQL